MASRKRRPPSEHGSNPSSPAQQDEADIVEEVGAEQDDESGELLADEERVRELGAVDAESVRENRRLDSIVGKKRGNVEGVAFNVNDVITKYETLIRVWPPNTLDISVKRLSGGTPVQHYITSRPSTGVELFEELKALHGQNPEAQYELKFFDNNSKQFRGNGKITMRGVPGAPSAQQGQQAMNYQPPPPPPFGYPPPQAAPPGYPPGYAPPGYPPPAAAPAVALQQAPAQAMPLDPMAMMTQLFGLMEQMRQAAHPPAASQQPQPPPVMMQPPPPPSADPATQMAWVQHALDLYQQMQSRLPPVAPAYSPPPQPQPQQVSPPQMMGPTRQPPPGMAWIWEPGYGFVLAPSGGNPNQGPPPGPRGPYRPYPGAQDGSPPQYPGPREPPPTPQTAAEQFRASITTMRTTMDAVRELRGLLPEDEGQAESAVSESSEDDSPVRVVNAGPAKIVFDKNDGSLRKWETGLANIGDLAKWFGEQSDKVQKARAEQQQREQPPRRQLPPGYVEMRPGDEPPPGFTAVPVDLSQGLPPVPAYVPPPISEEAPKRTWEMPTIPEGES